jgi:hypothetical protein
MIISNPYKVNGVNVARRVFRKIRKNVDFVLTNLTTHFFFNKLHFMLLSNKKLALNIDTPSRPFSEHCI